MDEEWRVTHETVLRPWREPPSSVEDLLARLRRRDAMPWARPFGADFQAAWDACPNGAWLFGIALGLMVLANDARGIHALLALAGPEPSGFGRELPVWTGPSADRIRELIDGRALLARAGLHRPE